MPAVSLIWRNSISIVLVSSSGTIQRLIIGPLNGCSFCLVSQIGATCCKRIWQAQGLQPHRVRRFR
jgi:hypothetical protein